VKKAEKGSQKQNGDQQPATRNQVAKDSEPTEVKYNSCLVAAVFVHSNYYFLYGDAPSLRKGTSPFVKKPAHEA